MKTLIVTAAGMSERFEGLKPKWMLTHPNGRWMIVEALKNFDFDEIDKIYLVFLKEHIVKYKCKDAVNICVDELGIKDKTEIRENIRDAGEDVREGETVIKKGADLLPAHIGMLAVVGRSSISVGRRRLAQLQ